ncbi:hypothetical protein DYB28_004780 [Aphanomyces astaci]|uniref:Peptidase S33 tripeptidyl aminopeptidase-like C-terminal domain-containing protein n=1 Tax=Aphanomyces astaci TaxID=112090 RepID=A0A9X8DUK9_APHAT|nr:hypothetical protein DYB28_004780 [Aphanomyces astaci]
MVPIALLLAAVATAVSSTAASPFNWQPCADSHDVRAQCGWLTVPLDHLDPANPATIDIAVRLYRTSGHSKGTIVLNPGGPGGSGLSLAQPTFATLTGGEHDLLGFDPRGVGLSRPVMCTQSSYTGIAEANERSQKPIPFERGSSETSFERYLLSYELLAKRCHKYDGREYLPYLSTAFVARDMDLIRAALGEHVFLGLTYVNMFPHRVGRVVIDSVLDPALYLGPTPELMSTSLADTEKPFEGFCAYCDEAGPAHCPLADTSPPLRPYLASRLRAFFDQLSDHPMVVPAGDDWTVVTSKALRETMFNLIISPSRWPQLATLLHSYMNGTASTPARATSCTSDKAVYDAGSTAWAVYVANEADNSHTLASSWEDHLKKSQQVSPLFGGSWYVPALPVKYWRTKVVERYAGPWNTPLRAPVLILNNEFDPETPLSSAQAVAASMGPTNGVLVTRDGYGHFTAGHPSRCLHQIVTQFFHNGSLPPPNTNCPVDGNPFVILDRAFHHAKQAMEVLADARAATPSPHQATYDAPTTEETTTTWTHWIGRLVWSVVRWIVL